MINRIKQRTSGLVLSLIGTGLPGRIRSTVVGMLAMTTAAGLALMLFLVQTSWPIPSLGPLTLPRDGRPALHGEVSLGGGAGSPGSATNGTSSGASGAGSALAVTAPLVTGAGAAGTTGQSGVAGNPPSGDLSGSSPDVHQGQDAPEGASQPANPAPATPVHQPGNGSAPEVTTEGSSEPTAVPSEPAPAPEAPSVPTSEPPVDGETPEVEEPPLEEEVETPDEGSEEEGEGESGSGGPGGQFHPGTGFNGVFHRH